MRNVFAFGLLMLAALDAHAQNAPQRVVSSLDIWVLRADSVAVGTIAKAVPGIDKESVDISVAVEEVFRGDPRDASQRHQERGQNGRFSISEFSRMSRNKTLVLVIGKVFTPLEKNRIAIPTATGFILRDPDQVVSYVRDVFRTHAGESTVAGFSVPLPPQLRNVEFTGPFEAGALGPPGAFLVPADVKLERWAIDTIRSGSEYTERAIQALKFFKSDSNVALVRELLHDLTHSGQSAERNNGIEIREYDIRRQAQALLKLWGEDAGQPVIHEEIPRFATVQTIYWNGRVTDAELKKFVDAGQLRTLEITSSPLTDSQLAMIGRITSLTHLKLGGVTNASLKHLRGLTNLEELDLGGAGKITDEGLAEFANLSRLKRLVLASTRVTDEGLMALTRLSSLKYVNLTLTQATKEGAVRARKVRSDLMIERADTHWTRMSPFAAAAFAGDIRAVRKYVAMSAHGNDEGGTPAIIHAVGQNHFDIVELLLDNHTRVDLQDAGKNTPLHWAAFHGNSRIAKLLLERRANVNHADAEGYTALHFAARNGDTELVRLLLEAGANPAAQTTTGLTPFDVAGRYNRGPAQRLLSKIGRPSA